MSALQDSVFQLVQVKPLINMVSLDLPLHPHLLACFCSLANQGVPWWAFYQWRCEMVQGSCFSLPSFVVHQMTAFLGWLPGVTHKEVKPPCMPAALIPSSCVFVCVTLNCVFWTKHNLVLSRPSLNRTAAVPTMLPGSGVGVLPFTVNPVTPTGSTNCDTGTITLHDYLKWFFGILTLSECMCGCVFVCVSYLFFSFLSFSSAIKRTLNENCLMSIVIAKVWSH